MSYIKNASPMIINLGANDKSIRLLPPEPIPIPQHLPKYFIMAQKGPTSPELVSGAHDLFSKYGDISFNDLGPYFNHATRHLLTILGAANTCMVQRVVPEDVTSRSNMCIYIDIVKCKVPNYKRNSNGTIAIDPDTDMPMVNQLEPEIDGYKIKFIKEHYNGTDIALGKRVTKKGTMVYQHPPKVIFDEESGEETVIEGEKVYSNMYPLFEFKARFNGKYYDNIGVNFDLIPYNEQNPQWLKDSRALFYNLTLFTRKDSFSSPVIKKSIFAESSVPFTFKNKEVDRITKERLDLKEVLERNYSNTTNTFLPLVYSDYETPYTYYDELNKVLKMFIESEQPHLDNTSKEYEDGLNAVNLEWFDFTTTDLNTLLEYETYLFNIFNGKSSKGVNYYTVHMADLSSTLCDEQDELTITENIPMFLSGGTDGTLSDENYEKEVVRRLEEYLDPDSPVQDTAVNLETIMYDSGFTLETKMHLFDFISLRKNTVVVLSTHAHTKGESYDNISRIRAIASALVARGRLSPESTHFGTPVCRAMVIGQSGIHRSNTFKDRLPLTFDFGLKAASMMGSGSGLWNSDKIFDRQPNNTVKELVDIQPSFIPNSVKPLLWDTGVIWVQALDRVQFFYPATKTIYPNDTSVLNSFYAVVAVATCSTIADDTHRRFTGSTSLRDEVFIKEVQDYMNKRLSGIFGGIIEAVAEVTIDYMDALRGFSWHAVIKLYANNMKTVMVYQTDVYRMSDLEGGEQ